MRISDWSSDVCSSDLVCREGGLLSGAPIQHIRDLRKTESEVAQQEYALQPDEGVLVVVAVSVVRDARRGKQADIAVVPQRPARRTGELRDLLNRPLHVRASPSLSTVGVDVASRSSRCDSVSGSVVAKLAIYRVNLKIGRASCRERVC